MPLLSALRVGGMALEAQRLAMEVAGNNIANANTPGYARQRVVMNPSAINEIRPGVHLGMGVTVDGIESAVDVFIEQRLRDASSDMSSQQIQEQALLRMEAIFNEMSDDDLSTMMSEFFNSIQDLQNRPEDASIRTLVVERGRMLASHIGFLRERLGELRTSANGQIGVAADQINLVTSQVAQLNVEIVHLEGGGQFRGAAGGLRTERHNLLTRLADLLKVRVIEDDSGAVNVYAGSDYLVAGKAYREVQELRSNDDDGPVTDLIFTDDELPLTLQGGKIHGYTQVRDDVVTRYIERLDSLSASLAFEFNKVYSQGRGLSGYSELDSTYAITDSTAALSDTATGLEFQPQNGSFNVYVSNLNTGLKTTTRIAVDLDGLGGNDTTADDLVARLDAVDGVTASLTGDGQIRLASESADLEFAFGEDNSYALAAVGINTFFTGSESADIGVNSAVIGQPGLFAAALDESAGNVDNAVALVDFQDLEIAGLGSVSIPKYLEQIVQEMAGESALNQVKSKSLNNFHQTLVAEREQFSGVSLDEEAIQIINFQHAYVAATRYITTIDKMLESLLRM